MGALLVDGIGDTLRVSLTADPVEEVATAFEILKALGLRERGPVMIACPSCGRDNVGVQTLAEKVEERLRGYPQHFEVAVLGCAVNGPGEAGDADFGIAGGRDVGFVYAHGRVLKKVSSDILIDELFHEIDRWIADGMHRPKRLKMAKPAALAMAEASLDLDGLRRRMPPRRAQISAVAAAVLALAVTVVYWLVINSQDDTDLRRPRLVAASLLVAAAASSPRRRFETRG